MMLNQSRTSMPQILLSCSLLITLLVAPNARAQPGPGSEIAFTLSYTGLDAEFDADAFGFDLRAQQRSGAQRVVEMQARVEPAMS